MALPPHILQPLAGHVPSSALALDSARGAAWSHPARRLAERRLETAGLPTRRDEYWRYTDPGGFLDYRQEDAGALPAPPAIAGDALNLVSRDSVFELPGETMAGTGVRIAGLGTGHRLGEGRVQNSYGSLEAETQEMIPRGLAAANSCFAEDGLLIECDGRLKQPLQLLHSASGAARSAMLHHVIDVRPGAELVIIESGSPAPTSNTVIEINIAEGASCHLIRIAAAATTSVCSVFASVAEGGEFHQFSLSAGTRWFRNESVVTLHGDNAVTKLAGAFIGGQQNHHDDTVLVIHEGRHCESRQVFKKVLRNAAKGIFQGKILVRPDAQHTDGYQISQALLIDDSAQFLAKPELEIYADDVACSHGSTSGGLEKLPFFYLRSRGLDKASAEEILALAFLAGAIDEVADTGLRHSLFELATRWYSELR
ncbi:MAG: SufD family Fe-S cluster assembly protein [Rhodobacteraceae bacterium]|nr:SufD family Fe-S cluster assembly protein [Paracoccaceae bacterium]